MSTKITVTTVINKPITYVWSCWTEPEHIKGWNFASDDWHCPSASNDVRVGGKLVATMAAKDGSFSFDFEGIYTEVVLFKKLSFMMGDDRSVSVQFQQLADGSIKITETFDAEETNPVEMQQAGWQAILTNFKKYAEK